MDRDRCCAPGRRGCGSQQEQPEGRRARHSGGQAGAAQDRRAERMTRKEQGDLFGSAAAPPPDLPPGFMYREDFISAEEEAGLLAHIAQLPLSESRYREWTAKRRTVSYGGSYDFTHQSLQPADPV